MNSKINTLGPIIKNLRPGLPERGKIKIGKKGRTVESRQTGKKFQLPEKLDHFLITTLQRDETNNFMVDENLMGSMTKDNDGLVRRIPIMLLFDDITMNFVSRYACYNGQKLFCTGNGEIAFRGNDEEPIDCPCDRSDPTYEPAKGRCKMNGILSCIIRSSETVGGVYRFRTTSYNSIVGITSSLAFIKQNTGGPLMGIPLDLVVGPKSAVSPVDGSVQTVYVVGIEFPDNIEKLRAEGIKALRSSVYHQKRLAAVEKEVLDVISVEIEDADETVPEFYPENADGYEEPKRAQINLEQEPYPQKEVKEDTAKPQEKEKTTKTEEKYPVEGFLKQQSKKKDNTKDQVQDTAVEKNIPPEEEIPYPEEEEFGGNPQPEQEAETTEMPEEQEAETTEMPEEQEAETTDDDDQYDMVF